MKFRKLFILSIALMFLMTGVAFAGFGAKYSDSAVAGAGNLEADFQAPTFLTPYGAAGGIAGAGGVGASQSAGGILWGTTGGFVTAEGGGWTSTDAGILWFPNGFLSIGVYSQSSAEAVTGASGKINISGFIGAAETTIGGAAAQGTFDASGIALTPLSKSNGFTAGAAGQGSAGGFVGGAVIGTFIGSADAEASAAIHMWGNSGASSYQYAEYNRGTGVLIEGQRSDVGAFTNVESSKIAQTKGDCLAGGFSVVEGGWIAGGGAATLTVQTNEYGAAKAMAAGSYSGHGSLGSNYEGSAVGYSTTSITTVKGMNGSINRAASGMQVTSKVTR